MDARRAYDKGMPLVRLIIGLHFFIHSDIVELVKRLASATIFLPSGKFIKLLLKQSATAPGTRTQFMTFDFLSFTLPYLDSKERSLYARYSTSI